MGAQEDGFIVGLEDSVGLIEASAGLIVRSDHGFWGRRGRRLTGRP